MKINADIIRKLNPCANRFNNYLWHYPDQTFDIQDFIVLDKITYSDKVWVITRLFTPEQNIKWSLLCASKVLSIFENKYPNDNRPRKALEACETYLMSPTEENKAAAHAAANAAAHAAANAAAHAAANAAAHAAAYAANAAATYAVYAAAAYAANAAAHAANAAAYAANARDVEEDTNLILMLECL